MAIDYNDPRSLPAPSSVLRGGSSLDPVSGSHTSGTQARPHAHLRDLVVQAQKQVDPHASIGKLLEKANTASRQAQTLLDFGRPDLAYTEYLMAIYIVSEVIPHHKDAPMLQTDHGRLGSLNRDIIKRINSEHERFDQVRDLIVKDNAQSGIGSSLSQKAAADTSTSAVCNDSWPSSTTDPSTSGAFASRSISPQRKSGMPSRQNGSTSAAVSPKTKPPVQPKPQNLHGIVIATNGQQAKVHSAKSSLDALTERFSRLRPTRNSLLEITTTPARPLTNGSTGYSPKKDGHPDKLSINGYNSTSSNFTKELPKPPSPTYSPIRSLQFGQAMQPPRSTTRGARPSPDAIQVGAKDYFDSVADHTTDYLNGIKTAIPYAADRHEVRKSEEKGRPGQRRRKSVNLPRETEITAERLYDYLKTFDVLLIDVRNREYYDSGHIFTSSGMCIEPTALRPNMSADELQDSLVLSPQIEQDMFDQRDEFDIVVYYDQSTESTQFLKDPLQTQRSTALRYLYDALYEFNQDKPLRYPPILLKGGMDAWIDLLGGQALATSNTIVNRKANRPLARVPLAGSSSRLVVPKRRHRDYNPLDPEEEENWRERARSESVNVLDSMPIGQGKDEAESQGNAEPDMQSYDRFDRRFPDITAAEQESFLSGPGRPPPEPPRVPSYPTPPPSSYKAPYIPHPIPSIPSRPPPAVPRPSYSGVTERIPSQSLAVTQPSQRPPYISPKLKRLPRTGLHNFNVTCYMNATIQCLSATIPLTAFFLDGQFIKYIQRDNWKGSKGLMPELYNTLLRNLWTFNDVDTIRPTNFRKFCARLNKEWGIDRQQDAKEFLEFLVDCLHEDLNVMWARNPLRALTPAEEAERERTPPFVASKREWTRYEHRDHSRLTDLFAGQHLSRLQCTTCHHSSTTYEPFYSISVEIPTHASHPNRRITLADCLRSYCSAEMLSGDEVWRCPHCRCEREATKRITITRAPEFLVIHFKRFSASHSERVRKVHTPIDFPLTDLDMEPFMLPLPLEDPAATPLLSASHVRRVYGDRELEDVPECMRPPYRYDAYAVMRHIGGTMTSGHYIAACLDRAKSAGGGQGDVWREFNDDRVTDFRPDELRPGDKRVLQNETAYIVFYQRVR